MKDIFGYLKVRHKIRTLMDLSLDKPEAMIWFKDYPIYCIWITKQMNQDFDLPQSNIFVHDFKNGLISNYIIKERDYYDLGWCGDFVERLNSDEILPAMNTLRHCINVVINVGSEEHDSDMEYITLMSESGFIFNSEETNILRSRTPAKNQIKKSLMFFNRI